MSMYRRWILYWWHHHCNTLQHAATRCNTLQHAATRCNTSTGVVFSDDGIAALFCLALYYTHMYKRVHTYMYIHIVVYSLGFCVDGITAPWCFERY